MVYSFLGVMQDLYHQPYVLIRAGAPELKTERVSINRRTPIG